MNVFQLAVSLLVQATLLSARWAGRRRRLCLEEVAGVADHSRLAELRARILFLEDTLALRDAHIDVLERRLTKSRTRRPYEPILRVRILWLAEYFQIPRRQLRQCLGVSRASVHRWLKSLQAGLCSGCGRRREPANKTSEEIAALVWEVFCENPTWGRHRIAMALWAVGVFASPTAVRDILLRPRPEQPAPAVQARKRRRRRSVRITAKRPNHTWSLDKTRVYRWGIWPTWVLVAVDHFSRKVVSVSPLYGSDVDWSIEGMKKAFREHGPPAEMISDSDPVFACLAFRDLLRRWGVGQRFGKLGEPGSVPVTERAILTLKQEWLDRVAILRGADHLEQLLSDFALYYNEYRGHMTLGGAIPNAVHTGQQWRRPERSAKVLPARMERRYFAEVRVTAFRLAA
jgi:transposase InsO family protein